MAWPHNKPLQTPRPRPNTLVGSEALRRAALEASWKRDRTVARRRLLWRWAAFYARRYAPHALGVLVLLAGALCFTGHGPAWPRFTVGRLPPPLHASLGLQPQTPAASAVPDGPAAHTLFIEPEHRLHSKEP